MSPLRALNQTKVLDELFSQADFFVREAEKTGMLN